MSEDLIRALEAAALEDSAGRICYASSDAACQHLSDRWTPGVAEEAPREYAGRRPNFELDYIEGPSRPTKSRSVPPPWLLGMSRSFCEQTDGVDRKMQGRILQALKDLSENDVVPHGDTIKPLGGSFKGCWRYRLGEYRLIFEPNREQARITLIAFLPRGSAYE